MRIKGQVKISQGLCGLGRGGERWWKRTSANWRIGEGPTGVQMSALAGVQRKGKKAPGIKSDRSMGQDGAGVQRKGRKPGESGMTEPWDQNARLSRKQVRPQD